jgi:hypothetical protein
MNLIPHYIVILKIIRRLSRVRNGIYRFIPLKQFFRLKTRKWIRHYDKKKVKKILFDSLGDFSQYAEIAVEKDSLLSSAHDALNQTFDLLGSGPVKLEPIDWHSDFKSGFRWPKGKFYKDYVIIDLTNNADVKVPWELSRSHHFLWLGQAYLLTKDEKYAEGYVKQINWWIDDNPVMRSINWTCAMDVSIRAVNWLYALNMFINSELITNAVAKKITKSLYEHAYFIYNNLEKYFPYSGNHYASNIVGLIYLGLFFNKNTFGKKWLSFALKEYFREIRVQVLPSGVHFEKSISYHRLVTEFFFYTQIVLENNDVYIPLDIRARIEKMLCFIKYYTKPDGTAPMIGDDDDGRFLPFIKRPFNDHRYLLCIATIKHKKPLLKKYAQDYFCDSFFILGKRSKFDFASIPDTKKTLSSKSFPDAGFLVIRHKEHYMFINNSGAAMYPDLAKTAGGHTHADMLSFELAVGQTTFLVDPGTYKYTSSPAERNLFRSTKMHNTLCVDGKNQHQITEKNMFKLMAHARPVLFFHQSTKNTDVFQGSHDGYTNLVEQVSHKRTVRFNKKSLVFEVADEINGTGMHTLRWHFHFSDKIYLAEKPPYTIIAKSKATNEFISLNFYQDKQLLLKTEENLLSPSYGLKLPSKTLIVETKTSLPYSLKYYIHTHLDN